MEHDKDEYTTSRNISVPECRTRISHDKRARVKNHVPHLTIEKICMSHEYLCPSEQCIDVINTN